MKELPKGLRLDKGYLQIRIFSDGLVHYQQFGKDSPYARELAVASLNEWRKKLLMWKSGLIEKHPFEHEIKITSKKFDDVAAIYLEKWSSENTPEGLLKHTDKAKYTCNLIINNSLRPFFGKMIYDRIRPVDVQEWREERLEKILGTTANREQAVLSSIFSHIKQWVETEQIKRFKLPDDNPCQYIQKATNRKRERILTTQELSVLKQVCINLNDTDLWEICKLALKSLLRKKDLMGLENGESIDLIQAKTGVRLQLPVITKPLNYINFRKRWEAARKSAALETCQFRDLRKTGANLLKMKGYSTKLMSEFLGHTSTDTTELYLIKNSDHLKPLAQDLENIVESL